MDTALTMGMSMMRGRCGTSLSDGALLVPLVASHTTIDGAVQGIVGEGPIDHAACVPHLVALLQQAEVVHVLDIGVDGVDVLVLWELVHNANQHENLIALAASVQEALAASEPQRDVLAVTSAADAADNALRVDRGHEHWVLDGAE